MATSIFDKVIDRTNTNAVKWDATLKIFGKADLLPMWVADMDFPISTSIQKALLNRIEHPLLGYTMQPDTLAVTIQNWVLKHHSWAIDQRWIAYSPGVISAISTCIQAFTEVGDKILIQSPIYTPFSQMITNHKREIVNSPLIIKKGRFTIDFEDFEAKLKTGVKLFLLCSPHNPGGTIWSKEELIRISELCSANDCLIVSDEIHADLYHSPFKHYPLASIEKARDSTITLMAPSKTFNIAGIQASILITSNKKLQKKIQTIQSQQGFHGLNIFAWTAMEAAYSEGEDWLNQLMGYLSENIRIAEKFIASEIPEITVMHPEASYLLWIDCRKLGFSDQEIQDRLVNKGKLALEPGIKYGIGGEGFVRMNIGCPRSLLLDGLQRLKHSFS